MHGFICLMIKREHNKFVEDTLLRITERSRFIYQERIKYGKN